jgi:hypothetical protein
MARPLCDTPLVTKVLQGFWYWNSLLNNNIKLVRSSLKTTLENKFKQPNSNNIVGPKVLFPHAPRHNKPMKAYCKIRLQFYSRQLLERIQATNSNNFSLV